MRKNLLIILSISLFSAFFAGCAQSAPETDDDPNAADKTDMQEWPPPRWREYEGPVIDPGFPLDQRTQYVDIDTYTTVGGLLRNLPVKRCSKTRRIPMP